MSRMHTCLPRFPTAAEIGDRSTVEQREMRLEIIRQYCAAKLAHTVEQLRVPGRPPAETRLAELTAGIEIGQEQARMIAALDAPPRDPTPMPPWLE